MSADLGPWIFAYGSLIFRPGFEYVEKQRARALGYARRFHQGSPDHRGTEEYLGRVVTLVPAGDATCEGIAYRLGRHGIEAILTELDHREKGGYQRVSIDVELAGTSPVSRAQAITWIASTTNPYWLGEEPMEKMLVRIRSAHGPSGANVDYVLNLRRVLRELGIFDAHVEDVARGLER